MAEALGALIPHGHRDVAQETGITGTLNRARPEHFAELLLGYPRQLFEIGREVGGGESGITRDGSVCIPWTDILTDVAAEDLVAHLTASLVGDGAAQLDCEICDAKAGIYGPFGAPRLTSGHDSGGGTGIDTTGTRAAMVRRWRASLE